MRQMGVWGGGAALAALLTLTAAYAADKPTPGTGKYGTRSVFDVMFGPDPKDQAKDAIKKNADDPKAKRAEENAVRSRKVEQGMNARSQEESQLYRRQDVCLQLRQVARETNDPDLEKLALQLDQKAWEAYLEKTSRLGGGRAALATDESLLDKKLPVRSHDTAKLSSAADKAPRGKDGTASVREVNP